MWQNQGRKPTILGLLIPFICATVGHYLLLGLPHCRKVFSLNMESGLLYIHKPVIFSTPTQILQDTGRSCRTPAAASGDLVWWMVDPKRRRLDTGAGDGFLRLREPSVSWRRLVNPPTKIQRLGPWGGDFFLRRLVNSVRFSILGIKLAGPVISSAWQCSQPIFTLSISLALGWEAPTYRKVIGIWCRFFFLFVFAPWISDDQWWSVMISDDQWWSVMDPFCK